MSCIMYKVVSTIESIGHIIKLNKI
jgi:hypothetical protein